MKLADISAPTPAPAARFECGCRYDATRFVFCGFHGARWHSPRIRRRALKLFGDWEPSMWPAFIAWKIQTLHLS